MIDSCLHLPPSIVSELTLIQLQFNPTLYDNPVWQSGVWQELLFLNFWNLYKINVILRKRKVWCKSRCVLLVYNGGVYSLSFCRFCICFTNVSKSFGCFFKCSKLGFCLEPKVSVLKVSCQTKELRTDRKDKQSYKNVQVSKEDFVHSERLSAE